MNFLSYFHRQINRTGLLHLQIRRYLKPWLTLLVIFSSTFIAVSMLFTQPACADFTIVVYPDSHVDSGTTNLPIWQAQNSWVLNNTFTQNIVAVLGVGDIVSAPSFAGYINATTLGYDLIDSAGLPYLPVLGNHDYDNIQTRTTTIYDEYFGPIGQMNIDLKPWYAGGYPNDSNANMAIKFDVGERKYLVLGLEFFPRESAVTWAQAMIDANPDREVIVVTHAYLTKTGTLYQDGDIFGPASYGLTQDYNGQELWDNFIKLNSRIFLVISAHDACNPNNAQLISRGINGNVVSQIQSNYQCHPNGGDGYILLLKVKPVEKIIEVTPYSTNLSSNDPNYAPYILPYNPSAPTIVSASVGETPPFGTTLQAIVNDNGAATTVNFEYGLTTAYGNSISGGIVNAGSGSSEVSANTPWLTPGTYHARVTASNIAGTATGNDFSFFVPDPPSTWPLLLTVTGAGVGFIQSTPAGLDCYDSFYANLNAGISMTFTAVPDSFSVFSGWGGDCSGLSQCFVTMNAGKIISAEFTAIPPAMVGPTIHQNLQDAFNETYSGATIKAFAAEFVENLLLYRDISISLDGGYDRDYIDNAGVTTVKGSLTIIQGSITINRLNLL